MSNTKIILISHLPLPCHKIGSWTKMYDNYLRGTNSKIDIIICPKPERSVYNNVEYLFYKKSLMHKLKSKLLKNRFYTILNKIFKLIKKNPTQKYIIQVVDNSGLLIKLCDFIFEKKLKNRIYIQYFFHGFKLSPDLQNIDKVFTVLDELILLTHLSLKSHQHTYKNLPNNINVLHNGIDNSLFNRKLRKGKESNKTIFLWCSQDRPKKGLHIIMEIWNEFYNKHKNTELWIVGTQNPVTGKGIKYFGKVNNRKLPEIYSKADVYLFPTQWAEPFGLTLIEALHCGCFCIASNSGGIPEVLNHGEFGWLVDKPDDPKNWKILMEKYLIEKPEAPKIPKNLYSLNTWSDELNTIIIEAKRRFK